MKEFYDTLSKNLHKFTCLLDFAKYICSINSQKRIVIQTANWLVVVPFWAVWPFETMILPKRQVTRMEELNETEQTSLAAVMKTLCIKYDNLFQCSFPYSMGWHGKYKKIRENVN